MTRRVLVTGGRGFIGSHLVTALGSAHVALLAPTHAEMPCDDINALRAAVEQFNPTTIVHLAGSLDRRAGSDDAQWRHTFDAGRNVVHVADELDVPHVVIAGTLDEYGPTGGPGDARPVSTYGLCKLLLREVAAHSARRSGRAIDWFRPPIVYGPGQVGTMLVPYACAQAIAGEPIRVSDGEQRREFMYVADVVDWIVRCISSEPPSGLEQHDLQIGNLTTVRAVLEAIGAAVPGVVVEYGSQPRRPGEYEPADPAVYRSDRVSLREWWPSVSITNGIATTLAWWRTTKSELSE